MYSSSGLFSNDFFSVFRFFNIKNLESQNILCRESITLARRSPFRSEFRSKELQRYKKYLISKRKTRFFDTGNFFRRAFSSGKVFFVLCASKSVFRTILYSHDFSFKFCFKKFIIKNKHHTFPAFVKTRGMAFCEKSFLLTCCCVKLFISVSKGFSGDFGKLLKVKSLRLKVQSEITEFLKNIGLQAPSRRDGKCITVCKRSAAYGVETRRATSLQVPQGRHYLVPAGLGVVVCTFLSVSCAALAYGYALVVPAGRGLQTNIFQKFCDFSLHF